MQKNVIITRSHEENVMLTQKIKVLGLKPIASSMLSYKVVLCDFTKFKTYTDLVITSKFAAQIVAAGYPYNINAYVVGDESAEILRQNQKIHVKEVYDSISSLQRVVGLSPDNTLYLSGNHISEEIPFVDRHIIYNTEYAKSLSPAALEIICQNRVDFLMFYSKNSAQNFIALLKPHIHLQNLQNSVVIAISREVADVLVAYVKDVLYPERPNAAEMIELLSRASQKK